MKTETEQQKITQEEHEALWDEKIALQDEVIQLRDQLADARLHAMDAVGGLNACYNLIPFLPLKDASRAEEHIQKGFKQALERASKCVARILEEM